MTALAQCRKAGCIRDALLHTGYCGPHTAQIRNKKRATSDGPWRGGPTKKLTDDQTAELRRMWAAFKPIPAIARHFGIDARTVRDYLKRGRS